MKLEVKYSKSKCIGANKCVEIHPKYFKLVDNQAVLKESTLRGKTHILVGDVTKKQASLFVQAACACPVNAIAVKNLDSNTLLASDTLTTERKLKKVKASYDDRKEIVLDQKGYFLIRIIPTTKKIEVAHCSQRNVIDTKITGSQPLEIYQTIIKLKLVTKLDHAAYLGRELQKAYVALQQGIPYIQDDELAFTQE